jgi:hypothetical protein
MDDPRSGPSAADHVGQAAGGITGVVAGAAIGATAGPIGVVLGGIAGAIGGWWSGRALAEAAEDITEADEQYYQQDFERSSTERRVDPQQRARFDEARSAYYLGDLASANPDYAARSFDEVEADLARGWATSRASHEEWPVVRQYASVGFRHGRERRRSRR